MTNDYNYNYNFGHYISIPSNVIHQTSHVARQTSHVKRHKTNQPWQNRVDVHLTYQQIINNPFLI